MSHTHTPVSASVIKSTSRFAPKAVPRKKAIANVPPPKPAPAPTLDEPSESEDEVEEHSRIDLLEDTELPSNAPGSVERNVEGVPTIQFSIPSIPQATPVPTPIPISTRSLRSSGPIPETPTEPPTSSTDLVVSSTSRKRRSTTTSIDDSNNNNRRRRRKSTPPTAEEVVISPATMRMSEMCIDKRTGRKSSRYAELQEAERQRRKLRELKREQQQQGIESETPVQVELEAPIELPTAAEEDDDALLPVAAGTARVMTDSNGNIILDQSSLQVDRHEIHPSTLTDSLIHTTETVFSSKTNSSTYASTRAHASNTIRWLPSDTERFYTALRMFGTDFGMVSTYLGEGKTRRHVKNKFDREEKLNPDKLTWALKNKLAVDVAGMEEKRGSKLRNLEEMKEELEGIRMEAQAIMALPRISQQKQQNEDTSRTLLGEF